MEMKLYDLVETILMYAGFEPNITLTKEGDIYELLNNGEVQYPCFVLTQNMHSYNSTDGTITYSFNAFFVDRLLEDKSNKLQAQTWATSAIVGLLKRLEDNNVGLMTDISEITTFTQQFEAITAGAYVNIQITVEDTSECVC